MPGPSADGLGPRLAPNRPPPSRKGRILHFPLPPCAQVFSDISIPSVAIEMWKRRWRKKSASYFTILLWRRGHTGPRGHTSLCREISAAYGRLGAQNPEYL